MVRSQTAFDGLAMQRGQSTSHLWDPDAYVGVRSLLAFVKKLEELGYAYEYEKDGLLSAERAGTTCCCTTGETPGGLFLANSVTIPLMFSFSLEEHRTSCRPVYGED